VDAEMLDKERDMYKAAGACATGKPENVVDPKYPGTGKGGEVHEHEKI